MTDPVISDLRRALALNATTPADYPHTDGDVTVLGPEIFASSDGNVICWKGEHYVRQAAPASDADRRHLAYKAVGPALLARREYLPHGARRAVADAVLAAVDTAPDEAQTEGGEAGPTPAGTVDKPDGLRQQYAKAIHRYDYEHGLSSNDIPSKHHRGEANAVLAVRDTELQQLRDQVDELIRRNGEYANRAIANGERADKAEQAVRNLARLADEYPAGIDTALIHAALDGQDPS